MNVSVEGLYFYSFFGSHAANPDNPDSATFFDVGPSHYNPYCNNIRPLIDCDRYYQAVLGFTLPSATAPGFLKVEKLS
ncbi:hypothetical protein OPQ81_011212 [Rhizoctonia solani]|nr:hypothetical protein OPQ81_011212 [Rhizoctonia solani]